MTNQFNLEELEGDLFAAPEEYALAHCVSADFRMGAGIAVKFRDKFKQVDKLKAQRTQPGGVAVIQDRSRFIYYLVTKTGVYDKPTYRSLALSLDAMKEHMISNGVQKVAMPRIGCGLDGLEWNRVRDVLKDVFSDTPCTIFIYNFVPKK